MTRTVEDFRHLYNDVRPHEYLGGDRPLQRCLAEPVTPPSEGYAQNKPYYDQRT